MPQQNRVLLLIPHLGGGGAERVAALLAQNLCREKHELHLGLITQACVAPGAMPPWVTVHALGASRVRAAAFTLLHLMRRLKPDVVLSGMAHLNFLVLLMRPLLARRTRVLVRQNAPVSASLASGALPPGTRLLYRLCYRHADRVICQTPAMAADLIAEFAIPGQRVVVLPNPVDVKTLRAACNDVPTQWTGPGPHLLAVGRLSPEKGFDFLLSALAMVRMHFPQADLVIAGAGLEEAVLKAQCNKLGLADAVRFVGYVERPDMYFPGATAFVLASRHEGLPNALLEAAAGGLPIVALPSSGGVAELLRGQPGIWLARDIHSDALTASLLSALSALRPNQRFKHAFVEQFGIENAIHAYEALIDRVRSERAR